MEITARVRMYFCASAGKRAHAVRTVPAAAKPTTAMVAAVRPGPGSLVRASPSCGVVASAAIAAVMAVLLSMTVGWVVAVSVVPFVGSGV